MPFVFDVLVQAARALDALEEGVATAGSNATLTDPVLVTAGWDEDDSFEGGTLFITQDHALIGAPPMRQSRVVSAYVSASGQITVSPVFSAAVAANDRYGVTTSRYPRNMMVGKLNEFLQEMGDLPTEDITSLMSLSGTLEYGLPVAAKKDLRQVWVAQSTAAPYNWKRLIHYRRGYSAGGAVESLIFPYYLDAGMKMKLIYMTTHPQVYADTDQVSDYVAVEWAAIEVAVRSARWRLDQPGEDRDSLIAKINDLLQRAARAQHRRRPLTPQPTPIFPYIP